MTEALEVVLAVAAAASAGAGVLTRAPRARSLCMALALALAAGLLAGDNWHDQRVAELRDETAVLIAAIVLGAAAIVVLAALMRRWASLFPLLAVAALPFRVPIDVGGESTNLLLPLYAVIAAGVLAALLDCADDGAGGTPVLPAGFPGWAARWLPAGLVAVVALYALQLTYSDDLSKGLQNLCFFYVPFAVLFGLLLRVRWSYRLLAGVFAVLIGEALLIALVAFVEYAVRDVLWNPDVETANLFHPYFRVNSLFWDPNILSRYFAVAIAVVGALMLSAHSTRVAVGSLVVSLVLLAGMALTFSQSGFVALLAGLVVLAALRWSARWTLALGGAAVVAAVVFVFAGGVSLDFDIGGKNLNDETSGRGELIRGGLELAEENPVLGVGPGAFSERFQERFGTREAAASASHTEPVTILAEQGAIGLILYLGLIAAAIAALTAGLGALAPGLRGFAPAPGRAPPDLEPQRTVVAAARAATLTAFIVMFVHSLSYAAFLTDPITWALLAVGLALVREPVEES